MTYKYRIRKVGRIYFAEYLDNGLKFLFITCSPRWRVIDWEFTESLARNDIEDHISDHFGVKKQPVIIPYP